MQSSQTIIVQIWCIYFQIFLVTIATAFLHYGRKLLLPLQTSHAWEGTVKGKVPLGALYLSAFSNPHDKKLKLNPSLPWGWQRPADSQSAHWIGSGVGIQMQVLHYVMQVSKWQLNPLRQMCIFLRLHDILLKIAANFFYYFHIL